jgi:hypothetical protein
VTTTLPSRLAYASLAPALCVVALLLVLCPQATAHERAACASSSLHHPGRRALVCGRPGHRNRVRRSAGAKRHRSRHKALGVTRSRGATRPAAAPTRVAALCEDGAAPVLSANGSFSCQDGSEPVCEGGATFIDGSPPVCTPAVASSLPHATCGDGSVPALTDEASFSCRDGSEPQCEAGAAAVPSSDGSALVCQLARPEEPSE